MSEPPSSGTLPKAIGRYQLRRELGRGMMGVVYEAHDPVLGRTIALKTIELAFPLSPKEREAFEQRFLSEARIAARLSHPGIVVVHDVGRDPQSGRSYIALEYLEGQTLAEIIKGGTLPGWREALEIVREIAEALHHAHSHGVVHRDIKPANVMILPSGRPKIMDFGIAKADTARIKLTIAGTSLGTPLYTSPEQALGWKVDGRSDLFSLGSIAYTLLTGRLAFAAENFPEILARVVYEDPPPPSRAGRDLPPEVDYLIARALAKAPNDRYPDGATLAQDTEDLLSGRPPRHRAGWTAPRRSEGTLLAAPDSETLGEPELALLLETRAPAWRESSLPPVNLEAELAALVSAPTDRAEPSAGQEMTRDGRVARAAVRPPKGRARSAPVARGAERARLGPRLWERPGIRGLVAAVALSVAALGGIYLALRGQRRGGIAPAGPSAAAAQSARPAARRTSQAETPALAPSSLPVRPEAQPAAPSDPVPGASVTSAQLAVDFEHPLKSGTLRVWVDDRLALKENLASSETRDLLAFKLSKGRIQRVLAVSPGRHAVRVQVAWEGNKKTETISGTFEAGAGHRLEIHLGRLRKNLSLEWRETPEG